MLQKFKITGDSQTIATSTSASQTALSAANLASEWLLVQNDAVSASANIIRFRLGGASADADGKGMILHGGLAGVMVKRGANDTHIGWDAAAATPNLLVTPVIPMD